MTTDEDAGTIVDRCRCGGEWGDHIRTLSGVMYCHHDGYTSKGWLACHCRKYESQVYQ